MKTGALYGILIGAVLAIARLGGPIAWMFVWTVIAGKLAVCAVLVWKRTRLPLMTISMAVAACAGLVLGFVGGSHAGSMELLQQHPMLIVGMVAVPPMAMFSEKWVHPEAWRRVKQQSARATLRDMLTFRHIPDLRVKAEA